MKVRPLPRGFAWRALVRFNNIVYRSFEVLCAVATAVVVVAVIYQVISRYFGFQFRIVFGGAPWSEEGAIFAFIWAVVLGNALGVRDQSHLVADILPETLGPMGDKLIASLSYVADLILGVSVLGLGLCLRRPGVGPVFRCARLPHVLYVCFAASHGRRHPNLYC